MSMKDLKQRGEERGAYILVDWDRTLVQYESWEKNQNAFGEPIPAMVERIQRWLHTGREVRIFTARVSHEDPALVAKEKERIQETCKRIFGRPLEVQNWKCFRCVAIWDDLAISVEPNTGWRMTSMIEEGLDPLSKNEEITLTEPAYKKHKT